MLLLLCVMHANFIQWSCQKQNGLCKSEKTGKQSAPCMNELNKTERNKDTYWAATPCRGTKANRQAQPQEHQQEQQPQGQPQEQQPQEHAPFAIKATFLIKSRKRKLSCGSQQKCIVLLLNGTKRK
jgi:hypothetical protein